MTHFVTRFSKNFKVIGHPNNHYSTDRRFGTFESSSALAQTDHINWSAKAMERFSRESAEDIAPTIEQHSLFLFPILLDVSSSDNLLGSETSNGAVSNIAAGAPDNQDDIEVVKAEISFYSTPHTEEFKRPVYDTLMHIKDSCHEDFVAKCSIANSLRRGENPPKQRHLSAIIVEDHRYPKTSGPERREQVRIHPVPKSAVGFRGPASIDGDSDSDKEEDGHDHDHHDHDHHDHDHHGHDHHDHHHDDHHHHHQIEEDVWFTGSLGFGQDGDTCLYENFPVLSNQCQLAVRDLHSLRSTYWEQEVHSREGPPMGHPCFLCVLVPAAFFFFIVFYNLKTRKMRKVNRAVMNAIESNPQLRAQGNFNPIRVIS